MYSHICFLRASHHPAAFCAFHKSVLVPVYAFNASIAFIIDIVRWICQPCSTTNSTIKFRGFATYLCQKHFQIFTQFICHFGKIFHQSSKSLHFFRHLSRHILCIRRYCGTVFGSLCNLLYNVRYIILCLIHVDNIQFFSS